MAKRSFDSIDLLSKSHFAKSSFLFPTGERRNSGSWMGCSAGCWVLVIIQCGDLSKDSQKSHQLIWRCHNRRRSSRLLSGTTWQDNAHIYSLLPLHISSNVESSKEWLQTAHCLFSGAPQRAWYRCFTLIEVFQILTHFRSKYVLFEPKIWT